MVSTLDFDFSDPSSNLGGTLNTSVVYFYNNNKHNNPFHLPRSPFTPYHINATTDINFDR